MVTDAKRLDRMYLRVVKILTFRGRRPLTNATGFFYLQDNFLYLITARHVVINETTNHRPDQLKLSLHADAADLQQRGTLTIPLYVDGIPQWYQHRLNAQADVVAISVNDPHVLSSRFVDSFSRDEVFSTQETLPLGQDVLILGFPLGFHDTLNNLPIVRRATIASSFSHPFKGEPYFLTDARLHRGMSGAPVIMKSVSLLDAHEEQVPAWRLLGIHSSALDVSDRDPDQDERLSLNTTWYASLLPEIIPPPLARAGGNSRNQKTLP